MMSAKKTARNEYFYHLGFRFLAVATATCSADDPERRRLAPIRINGIDNHRSFREAFLKSRNTSSPVRTTLSRRDLAATQIQSVVRGWRARVWSVKVVYDRAWRALLLLQAIWRGVLARRKLCGGAIDDGEDVGLSPICDVCHRREPSSKKQTSRQALTERHPERVAWEQSWVRIRLGCPQLRDKVRIWQTIVELKISGGRKGMTITNNEAWAALCDSAGVVSAAVTRLSSEDYLLGRRLEEKVCEIPQYLSLNPMALIDVDGSSVTPTANREDSHTQCAVALKGPGVGDVFDNISAVFYEGKTPTVKKTR